MFKRLQSTGAGFASARAAALAVACTLSVLGSATTAAAAEPKPVCAGATCVVNFGTPGSYTYFMPFGIGNVQVVVRGAQGGSASDETAGGLGGEAKGGLEAFDEIFDIEVGEAGRTGGWETWGGGGWSGAHETGSGGEGAGGGGSSIWSGETPLLIAGGGGGATGESEVVPDGRGGAGGGAGESGGSGAGDTLHRTRAVPTGGTLTAAGTGGIAVEGGTEERGEAGNGPAGKGLLGAGGNGAFIDDFESHPTGGAGGGGGYYGGGAGVGLQSAGGGSGYAASSVIGPEGASGVNEGGGTVELSWSRIPVAPSLEFEPRIPHEGETVKLKAKISGQQLKTGKVKFVIDGKADAGCEEVLAFTGTAVCETTELAQGEHTFNATYSGDYLLQPESSRLAYTFFVEPPEKAMPTLNVEVPAEADASEGFPITYRLAGGHEPTGKILIRLYGPGDGDCSGTGALLKERTVNGDITETPFTWYPPPGTYSVGATYSGDANNNEVTACAEVVLSAVTTATTVHASPPVRLGGKIAAGAEVTPPTAGHIVYEVFGPGDSACAGPAVYVSPSREFIAGLVPPLEYAPSATGLYSIVAAFTGDADTAPSTSACGEPGSTVEVEKAIPTLGIAGISELNGSELVGQVTLSDGFEPQGSVTMDFYGPDDADCSGTPIPVPVDAVRSDSYVGALVTAAPGTYRLRATYPGDSDNEEVTTPCNAPNSTSVARGAGVPATASEPVTVGGQIFARVQVLGETIGETLTIDAYGPGDEDCSGPPVNEWSKDATFGYPLFSSERFTATEAGIYRFVAELSGNQLTIPLRGTCGEPGSTVEVGKGRPTVAAAGVGDVALGGQIHGGAEISVASSGGLLGHGALTLSAYGPDDADCSGTPVHVETWPDLSSQTSSFGGEPFTPVAVGTYRFVASYSGDANYEAVSTECGEPGSTVVVKEPPSEPPPHEEEKAAPPPPVEPHHDAVAPPPIAPSVSVSYDPNHEHVPNPVGGARWTFRFGDPAAGTTFVCKLDEGQWKACSSPAVLRHLKRGRHVFAVKSIAADGTESAVQRVKFLAGRRR